MATLNMFMFGAIALLAVSFSDGLTLDGRCVIVYLAMILGVLMAIAHTLAKGS